MRSNQGQLRITAGTVRRAFTLVELLVVGAIIVILVALTLFTMSTVANSTRITKTRATIQKLDVAVQQIFVAYEDRFADIKRRVRNHPDYSGLPEETLQKIEAHFIRDLMRMELPQSWAEVYDSTGSPDADGVRPKLEQIAITPDGILDPAGESPLLNYYWEAYRKVRQTTGKEPGRAALLFLIIQNLNPEALESFHGSEVADTDGDGLLEFVDAWGNPIQFLRWAPAFPGSDLQSDVLKMAGGLPYTDRNDNEEWWKDREPELLAAMKRARINHPDPLDERGDINVIGWFLYPLIYSAGPDGKYGIVDETKSITGGVEYPLSPTVGPNGIFDPFIFPYGMPYGSDHFDNIHNHQWYRSF